MRSWNADGFLKRLEQSSNLTVAIVYLSLFVDNMLLTVVVPIVPDYIYRMQHKDAPAERLVSPSNAHILKYEQSINSTEFTSEEGVTADEIRRDIIRENSLIGLLLASKACVQLIANPFVGSAINRIGYSSPLLIGSLILLISCLMFAIGETFLLLLIARSIQGIGSACISIAGMGIIADRYTDNEERSRMMGIALGGIAVGVLAGYPFGSVMYDFVGKMAPFLVIASLIIVISIFQIAFMRPRLQSETLLIGPSIFSLLFDPFIAVAVGAICISTSAMAILEPCLPLWLIEVMSPPKWQLGTVFIPDSLGYLIGTHFFGPVAYSVGRWLTAMMSLLLVGACALTVPFATSLSHLLIPHFGIGLGIGITDASLMPLLACLVDRRHVAVYGTVYAIAQVAVCLAYSLGPLLGSQLVNTMGFPALMRCLGLINVVYSPLCWVLKGASSKEEKKTIVLEPSAVPNYRTIRANCKEGNDSRYVLFRDED